jgi:hypothetical protein
MWRDKGINTVIRNELKIFNSNNRIKNSRLNWIYHIEGKKPECIRKLLIYCTSTPKEQDPLEARSYAWRTNLSYRGTERIERSKP